MLNYLILYERDYLIDLSIIMTKLEIDKIIKNTKEWAFWQGSPGSHAKLRRIS